MSTTSSWRPAARLDYDAITGLCLALNAEDPGPLPVGQEQIRRTLATFEAEPWRGRAVVLDLGGQVAGYALLVSVWSNELGGEVCVVDELFVGPEWRGRGMGSSLLDELATGSELWPTPLAAVALEVSPANARVGGLYRRLGFAGDNVSLVRRCRRPASFGSAPAREPSDQAPHP